MIIRTIEEERERMRDRTRLNEASALRKNTMGTAKNLKDDGFDVDAIARSTGLTVDDVLKL